MWLASMPPPPDAAWQTTRSIYPGCPMRLEYRVDVHDLVVRGLVPRGAREQIVCLVVLPRGAPHASPPPGIEVAFGSQVEEDETYWVMQNGLEDCAFADSKIESIVLWPLANALTASDCPADIVAMAAIRQAQREPEPTEEPTEEPATHEDTDTAADTAAADTAADSTTDE